MPIDQRFAKARQAGIDVEQVGRSLAHYLSDDLRKVRENPALLHAREDPDNLTVAQKRTAQGVEWETLGGLPEGIAPITVHASSLEASLNGDSLRELLERRYRRELGYAFVRSGKFDMSLDGMRQAMRRAKAAGVYVAELR